MEKEAFHDGNVLLKVRDKAKPHRMAGLWVSIPGEQVLSPAKTDVDPKANPYVVVVVEHP